MFQMLLLMCACGGPTPAPEPAPEAEPAPAPEPEPALQPASLVVTSPEFAHEGEIPARFTCQGDDLAPALTWTGVPEGALSLALVVLDPDAPDPAAPKMTWVHWVAYDLPPHAAGLGEAGALPEGARDGHSSWEKPGWGGPCPPIGRHRYFFHVYALDSLLGDLAHPDREALEVAMEGHVLAHGVLMGTYEKS